MADFRFYHPIQVRYGDLDPQWHVNNAHTVTFLEQSRMGYLISAGLWDGKDFNKIGLIVADVHVSYTAPILLTQNIRVGIRAARLGNKSITFEYRVEDADTGAELATSESVMVCYDYLKHVSIPVPPDWREKITAFENPV